MRTWFRLFGNIFNWIFNTLLFSVLALFILVYVANQTIVSATSEFLYDTADNLPANQVGLVLGTSHRLRDGSPNPYFYNRMRAAANLFQIGKVNYLILSGDNRSKYYNEPEQMRKELLNLGVPDSVIYLDDAGLRTLDSVIRCKKVFGQERFTIISQEFHNQRAVYIAIQHNLNAVAFNAPDKDGAPNLHLQVREWFAKVNVFFDRMMNKQPRYTGERVIIGNHT